MTTFTRIFAAFALLVSSPLMMADESTPSSFPVSKIQSFVEAFETIREGYVEVLSDDEILQKALKGMVTTLDPHSEYFTKTELVEFNELTSGEYAGIGIEVELRDNRLVIVTPIDGTAASEAGILPGDVVVRIDKTLITDLGMQDIVNIMRGEVGTTVHLDVERGDEIIGFDLERRLVEEDSVTSKWLAPNVAYIRISQFQSDSGDEVTSAIKMLSEEQDINSLVLDLRNNPGGVLQSAVSVVDHF